MTEPHQSDLTQAIHAALKLSQHRDLEKTVDREGLAKALGNLWMSGTLQGHAEALADGCPCERVTNQLVKAVVDRLRELKSELAEVRRKPAQGGLPGVGEMVEIAYSNGQWHRERVSYVGFGIDGQGFNHVDGADKTWRRVPQPHPAVATKETP
jgi:hypothetical protein